MLFNHYSLSWTGWKTNPTPFQDNFGVILLDFITQNRMLITIEIALNFNILDNLPIFYNGVYFGNFLVN